MVLRPFFVAATSCASYVFGCLAHRILAVVDPHADLVDAYLATAQSFGAPIAAIFETHVQADHVSGAAELARLTGASVYFPEGAGVAFAHVALADGDVVELGNTVVSALGTPGHARAHHAYVVADHRRSVGAWLVFTGDSLLVGDVGRPDLDANGDAPALAKELRHSLDRLLALPDEVLVLPSHYGGSVCGRSLSGNPFSTIGFERRHNRALAATDPDHFADALLKDLPPPPTGQAQIVAANRR